MVYFYLFYFYSNMDAKIILIANFYIKMYYSFYLLCNNTIYDRVLQTWDSWILYKAQFAIHTHTCAHIFPSRCARRRACICSLKNNEQGSSSCNWALVSVYKCDATLNPCVHLQGQTLGKDRTQPTSNLGHRKDTYGFWALSPTFLKLRIASTLTG